MEQSPGFPGLEPDERNILVAPEAIILVGTNEGESPTERASRLTRVMVGLSQENFFPDRVTIVQSPGSGEAMIRLLPAPTGETPLSVSLDAASTAARLACATLYVGVRDQFIQYRDGQAP